VRPKRERIRESVGERREKHNRGEKRKARRTEEEEGREGEREREYPSTCLWVHFESVQNRARDWTPELGERKTKARLSPNKFCTGLRYKSDVMELRETEIVLCLLS
jgi:ribosomal protein L33